MDQWLEKMKEQLLIELGAKDNINPMILTSSPFTKRIWLETIPKKFMMLTLAAYDGARNPRHHMLNYKNFYGVANAF